MADSLRTSASRVAQSHARRAVSGWTARARQPAGEHPDDDELRQARRDEHVAGLTTSGRSGSRTGTTSPSSGSRVRAVGRRRGGCRARRDVVERDAGPRGGVRRHRHRAVSADDERVGSRPSATRPVPRTPRFASEERRHERGGAGQPDGVAPGRRPPRRAAWTPRAATTSRRGRSGSAPSRSSEPPADRPTSRATSSTTRTRDTRLVSRRLPDARTTRARELPPCSRPCSSPPAAPSRARSCAPASGSASGR